MEITIKIPQQPDGYCTPVWGPVFNPLDRIRMLVGECWISAKDELKQRGGKWVIYCYKE